MPQLKIFFQTRRIEIASFPAFFFLRIYKNHAFHSPLRVLIELDSSITRLLGINIEKDILYGTDRQLSYHAKESRGNFAFINQHHWFKASEQSVFRTATQLPDILVGQTPKEVYQWIGTNGILWGGKRNFLIQFVTTVIFPSLDSRTVLT